MHTLSIHKLLRKLIWLSMLPLLLLGMYLAAVHVSAIRQETALHATHRVQNATTLINNFVEAQIAGLTTLANSPLLNEPQRLAEFYPVAQGFQRSFGVHFIVTDQSLQMLLNTREPFGKPLPALPVPRGGGQAAGPAALAGRAPAVGDIIDGPVAKQPLVAVAVPVLREGSPPYLLLSTMEVGQIAAQLEKVSLPEGWTLVLLDGKGETIARHPQDAPVASPGDVDALRRPVIATGSRWQVALEIDRGVRRAPLYNATAALLVALLAAAVASYLFGRTASRFIVRAISSLNVADPAGLPPLPGITEVEAIRTRLAASAESLRSSEERYRRLFHNHHTVMLLIDPADGSIVDANPAAERFYGWTREELLAKRIDDLNMLSEAEIREEMERAVQEKRNAFRFRHRRTGGDIAEVAVYSGPVEIARRKLLYSIIHDETERVRAESALHASEARYEELFAANPQPMWFYDLETLGFLAVNAAAVKHYGYSEAEFLAMTIADIRPREDLERLNENLIRTRQQSGTAGPDRAGIWRHLRKDGSIINVEITSHVLEFKGRPAEVVLAADVTERLRAEEHVAGYVRRLEKAMLGTAEAISEIMDLRDPYTAGHEKRVGDLAAAIAKEMNLAEHVQRGLHVAGDLHDIGKIVVPVEILVKPGKISAMEFELIKQHPQKGYDVLKGIDFPWPVAEVARQHHERIDGSGYPRGLKGDAILLEARIVAVADVVEAMSSHRPYRASLGVERALTEIEIHAGLHYDAEVVAACLRLFREKGYQLPQ